ncbi:MAG: hypothetical protein IIB94_05735 [Candidatus Marinimicrobia bacterium]|nr:hypothetical protein [Candidatus Neomarinimicrobiota bacterium]
MSGQLFLALSLGLIGYLSKYYLEKDTIQYKLLSWISVLLMTVGVVYLLLDGIMGGVIAFSTVLLIILLAKGLESDKRFLKKIYSQIDEYRSLDPEINNAEIMNKIIKSNFPKIKQPIINEIISDSEDLEEMIYKATEYDETGKIKKPYPPENLDDLDDLEDF